VALKAFPVKGKQKSIDICAAFVAGAPGTAHGAVFFGVDESNLGIWSKVRASDGPWWYIDNSYFDCVRGKQFRVTRNALQFCNARYAESTGDRFDALGLRVQPWQHNLEGHWLVCPQSDWFMRHIVRAPDWFKLIVPADGEVRTRTWLRDKLKRQATLTEDLQGARCLITHTSAAAVGALIEGVPAFVSEQSAVSGIKFGSDRHRVLHALADNQFTLTEMKEGKAWAMLNK
jgi:hypothetical protein